MLTLNDALNRIAARRAITELDSYQAWDAPPRPAKSDRKEVVLGYPVAGLGRGREYGSAVVTGQYVEVCLYASALSSGPEPTEREKTGALQPLETQEERERKSALRAAYRSQKQVRRLMNTNNLYMMYTCTFACSPSDGGWAGNTRCFRCVPISAQRSYKDVKRLFRNFWQRLRRAGYEELKWLVVFELHDSPKTSDLKRGTWHVHIATDTDIPEAEMLALWTHGTVCRDDFRESKQGTRDAGVRNPGAYMSKYIGKSFTVANKHLKRYSRSRNMRKPLRISAETFFDQWFPRCGEVVYHTERDVVSEDGAESFRIINITYKLKNNGG